MSGPIFGFREPVEARIAAFNSSFSWKREDFAKVTKRTVWPAADLMTADLPPPEFAVPGLIPCGLTLLAAAPKSGKSWLMLSLAVAVAAGGDALGKIGCEAGDVLYLALEDTASRLQDRLRKILGDVPPPERLTLSTELPELAKGGDQVIDSWLTNHPAARLVIIDVFAKVRGTRGSSYTKDYTSATLAKTVGDKHGVAVVLVHHTIKMTKANNTDFVSMVGGSPGLTGAADAIAVLLRQRGAANASLMITGRDVEETAWSLEMAEHGGWRIGEGEVDIATFGATESTRDKITKFLRDNPRSGPKTISLGIGAEYANVKVTLGRMLADRKVTNDNGHYSVAA